MMSKQRELIMSIVKCCDGHITAQAIFDIARIKMPHISFGTVYRNLGRLCEEKLIREVPVTDGAAVYEMMQIPHGHLVCERCQRVVDFPITDVGELEERLDTKILSCSFCVTHICKACKNKI